MKVLFVCNNAYTSGNGVSTSARVTTKRLREAGLDVRILCSENPDKEDKVHQPDYKLSRFHFPIFQPLIDRNSYCFAKDDMKVIREAVDWADLVHIEEPFFLDAKAARYANKTGKTVVGTFHLFTQNIFYNIINGRWPIFNRLVMLWFRSTYNLCSHVQCPTETVRALLDRWHFKPQLHVISNGTRIKSEPKATKPQTNPYVLLMTGRYSNEKDPLTLLKAMRYCRHSSEIQLEFAGRGGLENKMRKFGRKLVGEGVLKYEPHFGFYTPADLKKLTAKSYLYVHCAVVEVEGLSCLEAIRDGVVPVIAEAPLSATSQFALCPESKFPVRKAKALAERIDWWIEHPEERDRMSLEYAKSALNYDVMDSTKALISMYEQALSEK